MLAWQASYANRIAVGFETNETANTALHWNRVKRTCSRYEHQFSVDLGHWVGQPSNRSIVGSVPKSLALVFPLNRSHWQFMANSWYSIATFGTSDFSKTVSARKNSSNTLNPNGRRLHLITSLRRGMGIAQSVARRVSEIYSLFQRANFLDHVASARNADLVTLLQRDFALQVGGSIEESSL